MGSPAPPLLLPPLSPSHRRPQPPNPIPRSQPPFGSSKPIRRAQSASVGYRRPFWLEDFARVACAAPEVFLEELRRGQEGGSQVRHGNQEAKVAVSLLFFGYNFGVFGVGIAVLNVCVVTSANKCFLNLICSMKTSLTVI